MTALALVIGMGVLPVDAGAADSWRPEARWRGFNLLGMFVRDYSPGEFAEEDFQLISELGFNFVRLPLDYRYWIKDGDWTAIDESKLAPIDRAVALGKKYRLHVQLCFHRAPGYTVAQPPEARDLFRDDEALKVCCWHWSFFARRYRDVSADELSFNLFNEPGDKVTEAEYERVAAALVQVIRAENPARLIVADGLAWGNRPAMSLFKLGVGQAMRGYRPMSLTHYMASWVGTPSDDPVWPPSGAASPLYGPDKAPLDVPLVIENVPSGTLSLRPGKVSGKVCVQVEADGGVLNTQVLDAGQGSGWTNVEHKSEWKITQAKCLMEIKTALPKDARRLSIRITAGDWAELSKLTLTAADGRAASLVFEQSWGKTNDTFRFAGWGDQSPFQSARGAASGHDYLEKESFAPWRPAFDAGVFVTVGEFGAFNRTPHPIVLAWMEDNLKLWKEHNLGWALWEFRGSIGVLDSGRQDVAYEDFHGHKLDRKMLDLLQKY